MQSHHLSPTWDKLVRSIHWAIAILFVCNQFFTEAGYSAHVKVGWTIFGLVVLRIVWGLSFAKGPNRISNFLPTKKGFAEHLHELKTRTSPPDPQHNAFGSLAIFLLWFGLLAAPFTGWLQDTDWGFDNGVDDWHEFIVESLWVLALIHIAAVVLTSLWLRRNLIKAMLVGR